MPLSPREQALYDRLRAKKGGSGSKTPSAPARRAKRRDADEEEGIFVLSGRHADGFLEKMFGPSKPAEPDDDEDLDDDEEDGELDDDDEDLDDDEDEEPEPDPEPSRGHRYFAGGGRRG